MMSKDRYLIRFLRQNGGGGRMNVKGRGAHQEDALPACASSAVP